MKLYYYKLMFHYAYFHEYIDIAIAYFLIIITGNVCV